MKYLISPLLLLLSLSAVGDEVFFCHYDKSWTFLPPIALVAENELPFVPDKRTTALTVGFNPADETALWDGNWYKYSVLPLNGLLFLATNDDDQSAVYAVSVSFERDGMSTVHTSKGSIHNILLGKCDTGTSETL